MTMTQQTMSEREMYLGTFEAEYQTTLKILKAYPADQVDLKPGKAPNSARDIIWTLVMSQMIVGPITSAPEIRNEDFPPAPKTLAELIGAFENAHRDAATRVGTMSDDQFNGSLRMPVGPKQMADVRRGQALWMMLMDTVHHRGQLSVYLRVCGAKLPSIYGPTLDEPWN